MASEIIFPPPDIRSVIDKTAEFVAKVGDDFEKKVVGQQAGQAKFAFLNPSNPYRKYYELRVKELREGTGMLACISSLKLCIESSAPAIPQALLDMKRKEEEKRRKRAERKMLGDGAVKEYPKPDPTLFHLDHPLIAPVDEDILKITAQFVARNGVKFLTGLSTRESRNPQYDFLKPDHFLFEYFQQLVESYTKLLLLRPTEKEKIALFSCNRQAIIDKIMNRYLYESQQEQIRLNLEKVENDTRESTTRIDWFNFAVVETLSFPPEGVALGTPIDPRTGRFMFSGTLPAPLGGVDDALPEEEEIQMDEEFEPSAEAPLPTPTVVDASSIRTDYVRVKKSGAVDVMIKSPVTGELIREADFSQHMRIVLLDPKWKDQSEKVLKRAREEGLAYSEDIADNIAHFVASRGQFIGDDKSTLDDSVTPNERRPVGPQLPAPPPAKRRQTPPTHL